MLLLPVLSSGALLGALALAPADVPAAPGPVAFVRVTVVPMDRERRLPDHTVLVQDGRIARVGPAAEVDVPAGFEVVDGHGELFLAPGLVDSHIHVLEPDELTLYLVNGVTTVRNMSGEPFHLAWREQIAAGRREGPRLLTAGPTLDGGPPEGSNRIVVTTREEAERAAEQVAAAGYDVLKVYGALSAEAHAAIAAAGRRLGLRVVGHLPRAVGLEGALAAGQSSIDHAEEYLYTFFRNAGPERIPEAVRLTRDAGAFLTPTLVTYATIARQIEDAAALAEDPALRFVDPVARQGWLGRGNRYLRDFEPAEAAGFWQRMDFLRELVRQAHAGGVTLLAGTDAGVAFGVPFVLPGFSLHEELAELVACGLSPYEALRTATVNPEVFLRGDCDDGGVVAEGARADLLLVRGDPLQDSAALSSLAGVMVSGRWLPEAELDARREALVALYRDEAAFFARVEQDGLAAAAAAFRDERAARPGARGFRESRLNALGYDLLGAGRTEEALVAFQLNLEAYPGSADAHDSLGEAFRQAGDTERAIEHYERSLALDPRNANAAAVLEELRAGP